MNLHQQTKVIGRAANGGDAITMTSLDFLNNFINPARIAAGESKVEHGKFLARVLDELDGEGVEKFSIPHPQNKQPTDVANLNMDHLTLVGMRESKAVRRSVLSKLKALDEQVRAPQAPREVSRKDLALMVLQAEEENERLLAANQVLELQLEETKPVIDAFDRIADADGSLNVTEAAKALQVGRDYLFNYLSSQRWIYKRAGSRIWLGYQERVQQGFLTHKVTTQVMPNGVEAIREQVRITPKGLAKLAKMLGVVA